MKKYFFAVSYFYGYDSEHPKYDYVKMISDNFKQNLGYQSIELICDEATKDNVDEQLLKLSHCKNSTIVLFFLGQASKVIGEIGRNEPETDSEDEYFKLYDGGKLLDNEIKIFRDNLDISNTLYIFVNSCNAEGMIKNNLPKFENFSTIFRFSENLLKKTFSHKFCDNIFIYTTDENSSKSDDLILDLLYKLPEVIKCKKISNFEDLWNEIQSLNSNYKYFSTINKTNKKQIKSI